jgi:malonate-semialdehyde dehydrogenase (acetylating)/methylmalonate-semialdehyde dehydrogenase
MIIGHIINGQRVINDGALLPLTDPATGEKHAEVVMAGEAEAKAAIAAAKAAWPEWQQTTPLKRAALLTQYARLIREHTDELASIISSQHGKTIDDAKGSIQRGLDVVDYAISIPNLLTTDYSAQVATDIQAYSLRQPVGLVLGITPFNFPVMVPLWMFPIAIMCGNPFILKPSERDPLAAVRLVELFHEAGFPKGLLQVLQGDKWLVERLITDPEVAAVSSVGSTAVAKHIYQLASNHGKRVQTFGGAKNHAVVMADADMDYTADAIAGAAFGSAGQRCMAIAVVVTVGQDATDALLPRLIKATKEVRIGSGTDLKTQMGPLVNQQAKERVLYYLELAEKEGSVLHLDGRQGDVPRAGCFVAPSIISVKSSASPIWHDEIFGPVLCHIQVDDIDAALALIHEHDYGNGSAIFTEHGGMAQQFAAAVSTGMVGINVPVPVPPSYHSFGGWKQSMFGDLDMHGPEGVQFYTRRKTVTSRWKLPKALHNSFTMPIHQD